MKVIGAGIGRTGTVSLRAALERLGFGPVYGGVVTKPDDGQLWLGAFRGEPMDWKRLFDGCEAALNWPVCAFWEQLIEVYPEAKVILTVRDPERWYESMGNTSYAMRRSGQFREVAATSPDRRHFADLIDVLWQQWFNDRFEDKEHALASYQRHIESVKAGVPPERLLVFEVQQGWGPLCEFLGVEPPTDEPFPRLNDTDSFRSNFERHLGRESR